VHHRALAYLNAYNIDDVYLVQVSVCLFVCLPVCVSVLSVYLQRALAYLNAYNTDDVYLVQVFGSSASIWEISNPSRQQLCQDLVNPTTNMAVTFALSVSRYVYSAAIKMTNLLPCSL